MLISAKLNSLMNEQIGHEMGASMQYIAIATYFATESLSGLAAHFFKQADEEREHAMRFVKYLLDAGGHVEIPAIPAPRASFKNAEEAVKLSLDWEMTVTRQINDLVTQSISEKDYIGQNFLGWFVNEQLEEVSSMDHLLRMVKRAGEARLIFVDNYVRKGGSGGSEGSMES